MMQYKANPRALVNVMLVLLGGAFLLALYERQWLNAFVAIVTFALATLPVFIQKRFEIYLPNRFMWAIAFFVYATIFLGEVQGFYDKIFWWDVLLHAGAAVGLGLIGFVTLLLLYREKRFKANALMLSVFAFSFALAIGVLWEIFEFFMDQTFGFNMQKSGLRDTMWDLIVDASGAFLASAGGFLYLKKGKSSPFGSLLDESVSKNKNLLG